MRMYLHTLAHQSRSHKYGGGGGARFHNTRFIVCIAKRAGPSQAVELFGLLHSTRKLLWKTECRLIENCTNGHIFSMVIKKYVRKETKKMEIIIMIDND